MTTDEKFTSILFFGCPGSGKGTQGVVLGRMPNICHLAMGDIFRALDKKSPIGKEFLSYSTKGLLVPDELTVRVFRQHLDALVKNGELDRGFHTLILDGIPRTIEQVRLVGEFVDFKAVVYLDIDDREALIERLSKRAAKSGRPDDADRKVIENRLDVYERETQPVLQAFTADRVLRINADQHPLAVLRDIAAALVTVVPANL